MKLKAGVVIPHEIAAALRDCVRRALRALADVQRLRGHKGKSADDTADLVQCEARLDSLLIELCYTAAKIFQ